MPQNSSGLSAQFNLVNLWSCVLITITQGACPSPTEGPSAQLQSILFPPLAQVKTLIYFLSLKICKKGSLIPQNIYSIVEPS